MKLIIVGGHVSPALAVLDALPKDVQVCFVGRKKIFEGDAGESLEYKEVKKRTVLFENLVTGRLQRSMTRHTIPSLLKLPVGVIHAITILKRFRPDVVLIFGGYLGLPVGIAARILRVPIVLHEQTLEAGLTNKLLAPHAKMICISWEQSQAFFPRQKTVLTGIPMRKTGETVFPESISFTSRLHKFPLVYVTGGSGGSHPINTLIAGCLKDLLEKTRVIHQTGDAKQFQDFEHMNLLKNELPVSLQERYKVVKFIDPAILPLVYKHVSLVVGRSGMNTVSELIVHKVPALLIPLPHAQGNEQFKNAVFFVSLGLGEVVDQEALTLEKLSQKILSILNNTDAYKNANVKDVIPSDAAEKIIKILYHVTEKEAQQQNHE